MSEITDKESKKLVEIASKFNLPGKPKEIEELKRGHINRTFMFCTDQSEGNNQYVLQKINHDVFRDVKGLMSNVIAVTSHLNAKISSKNSAIDKTLTVIPLQDGTPGFLDNEGWFWRVYPFIQNTVNYEVCPSSEIARECGEILGRFQSYLQDLPINKLVDTIPFFHHVPKRYQAMEKIIDDDPMSRVESCRPEIEFAREYEAAASVIVHELEAGNIPKRVAHHDMKLNNILFDSVTEKAVCVVDLDTCMVGSVLSDIGDLLRNTSVASAEDEVDLNKVQVDKKLVEVIVSGYLKEAIFLTPRERELIPEAPTALALMLGVRFLTDHLQGDTYFRIHRKNHNLDRARAQFEVARKFMRST